MKTKFNAFLNRFVKRCPKSGKIVAYKFDTIAGKLMFPVIGILSILWFLIRVVPKPDRAAYPCQQVAFGFGASFLTYMAALILSYPIFVKLRTSRYKSLAILFIVVLVGTGSTVLIMSAPIDKENYVPVLTTIDKPNQPIGKERGIFPGRVVWVRDLDATSWDEENGEWWDDQNTNQAETDKMFADAITQLTGEKSVKKAWNTLFLFHNQLNGKAKKGYSAGEKIVIKLNLNAIHNATDKWKNQGYPSPHMVNSMIKQLINEVGVKGEDIILTDPSRHFVGPICDKLRSNESDEYKHITFVERKVIDKPNHILALPDTTNLIYFNMPDGSIYKMCLPQCFSDATYIIDYALVRPHRVFGITNVAKNHFGSVWDFKEKAFMPNALHAFALWDYPTPNKVNDPHSNPVLLGHKTIHDKTVLYLADGLYTSITQTGPTKRFSSMNNDWFSSLLLSQDPVALESVCFDFISSEPNLVAKNPSFNGNQDNQFHEAALANNPPSGVKYDPENDGTPLQSLGVHEHWNNAKDKQYSRNLGKKNGIELVSIIQ